MTSPADSPIRLIVGLGNPGSRYEPTRHNAGFWFVDQVARQYGGTFRTEGKFHGTLCRIEVDGVECRLLKPDTFMNRSGRSVGALLSYYRLAPEAVLVAHDELDFEPGVVRLKRGGGHGGHNGLRDILAHLGQPGFNRLRIGIGHPGESRQVVDYVLKAPGVDHQRAIEESLDLAAETLPELLSGAWQRAVNRLHTSR